MFVITKRDEDGTWYAHNGSRGVINCWTQPRDPEILRFYTREYAQTIANRTTRAIRNDYICGPCKVQEVP